jgi:glucosamine-6-phosphate deaminase
VRIVIERDAESASRRAASMIADLVRRKPDCVLGLATGGTPLGTYCELIRLHREEGLDFSRVRSFNLDEYVGLDGSHPQSYRYFMQNNLFNQINIRLANTHVPDGMAADFEASSREYEQKIRDAGGIDLQLLGIGTDGHIGFNEPGSSLGSRTRVKTLAKETIRDNARFFSDPQKVPRLAVTMGVGTILEARQCLLVAFGESKAAAIRDTVEGPITARITASALQLHPKVVVVLDELAAGSLARRDYYAHVEHCQRLLEQGQFEALGLDAD